MASIPDKDRGDERKGNGWMREGLLELQSDAYWFPARFCRPSSDYIPRRP